MRYILIWADYMSTGLREEAGRAMTSSELGLAPDLSSRLKRWVERYEAITPLDEAERAGKADEIQALDKEGVDIARCIRDTLAPTAKVSYFSEGLLKRLPV
jgi:hypothetical protein